MKRSLTLHCVVAALCLDEIAFLAASARYDTVFLTAHLGAWPVAVRLFEGVP